MKATVQIRYTSQSQMTQTHLNSSNIAPGDKGSLFVPASQNQLSQSHRGLSAFIQQQYNVEAALDNLGTYAPGCVSRCPHCFSNGQGFISMLAGYCELQETFEHLNKSSIITTGCIWKP